jgi:hypothetical protein
MFTRVSALAHERQALVPPRWTERTLPPEYGVDRFLAMFIGLRVLFTSPNVDLLDDGHVPELLAPLRADYRGH